MPDSKCDFCSEPNPRWSFPAQSFYHKTEVKPVDKFIHAFMREEWAACDVCCFIIHNGTALKLAERVYHSEDVRKSLMAILFRKEMLSEVMAFQDTFRRNRLQGPPVMING